MKGTLEKRITLDLERSGVQARISARQGDALVHRIIISLTADGKAYLPEGAMLAQVYGLLPDGSTVSADAEITGSTVTFIPGGGFFAAGGPVLCRLTLRGDDGGELYSPAFAIDADPCFAAGAPAIPAEEYSRLEELFLRTLAAQNTCQSLAEEMRGGMYRTPLGDAEPKADGTASAGVSANAAREDHVHPTDTSRMPAISEMGTASNAIATDSFPVYVTAEKTMKKMMFGRLIVLMKDSLKSEEWTFVMKDGSTVVKEVIVK